MSSKNSLIIGRAIFLMFIIISLGLIIMNEKGGELFKNKISDKVQEYLQSNYSSLNVIQDTMTYQNNTFTQKITSKSNKNLYFYISYKNKEIKDTYKKDYQEGTTLLTYLNKKLEEEIEDKTNITCKVSSISNLNDYTDKVQERIIKEDNLLELKYYYIEKEFVIKDWNKEVIAEEITNLIKIMSENKITPKYYVISIIKKDDITTSIKIKNITEDFINLENKEEIIQSIIEEKDNELLKENKITVEYEN